MSTRRWWPAAAVGTLLVVATTVPVAAQLRTYGVGRAPTVDEVKAWDRDHPGRWRGVAAGQRDRRAGPADLPSSGAPRATARRARTANTTASVGGRGSLATDNPVLTVGSFWQYAPTLWSYIRRSQPVDEPGSLTARPGLCGHRLPPPRERHHRRARTSLDARTPAADQDAEPRRVRARRPARRREGGEGANALAREGAVMSARRPVGRQGHGARPRGGDDRHRRRGGVGGAHDRPSMGGHDQGPCPVHGARD